MPLSLPRHKYLGREEIVWPKVYFPFRKALVTGGKGSIGRSLCPLLEEVYGCDVYSLDLDNGDVCNERNVKEVISDFRPEVVFHLAAHKYATKAEDLVIPTVQTNIVGTDNVLRECKRYGVMSAVVASTCKAIQPQTVYGSSKLICERSTLNAGYTVARLYNTVDTCGNVFELWEESAENFGYIKAAPCHRYFQTTYEAIALLLHAASLNPGRFCIDPGDPVYIPQVAVDWAKDYYEEFRKHIGIEAMHPRRGDRLDEPLIGDNEEIHAVSVHRIVKVIGSNDGHPIPQ